MTDAPPPLCSPYPPVDAAYDAETGRLYKPPRIPPPPASHPPRASAAWASVPSLSDEGERRRTTLAKGLLSQARPGSVLTLADPATLSRAVLAPCAPEDELSSVLAEFRRAPYGHEYAPDGCSARAHLLANALQGRGVFTAKLFVRPRRGHLLFEDGRHGRVSWKFHVAPIVFVRAPDGERTARALDVGIGAGQPLSVGAWLARFDARKPVTLSLTDSAQYSGWARRSSRPDDARLELWPHALEHAHRVSVVLGYAHARGAGSAPLELVVLAGRRPSENAS